MNKEFATRMLDEAEKELVDILWQVYDARTPLYQQLLAIKDRVRLANREINE